MMKLSTMNAVIETVKADGSSEFAERIAQAWQPEPGTVKIFRASANFIFTFQKAEEIYILRFNHDKERKRKEIEEEIKLLNLLNKKFSNIVIPVKSTDKNFVETINTDKGTYHAVVFNKVNGKMYEFKELNAEKYYTWGKSLGKLHRQMSDILRNNEIKRKSWHDHLNFIEKNLPKDEYNALEELKRMKAWLTNLDIDEKNYGLIHFDFELDNLFWEEDELYIVDFDDAAYYWYVADIAFALRDLFKQGVNLKDERFREFINGYKTEFYLDDDLIKDLPKFLRFHNLTTFTKLLRTLDIKDTKDKPDWLVNLKNKLSKVVKNYRENFPR